MAVFIAGVTTCPLCGLTVQRNQDAVNFPPLFLNQHHDVFEVTDSVVHRSCLAERPYARLALDKLASYDERRTRLKLCKICGRVIADPDDYFGTGPLSDDPREDIARLDWFEAHIGCLRTWKGRPQLLQELLLAASSADWEGGVLQGLASRLMEIGSSPEGSAT